MSHLILSIYCSCLFNYLFELSEDYTGCTPSYDGWVANSVLLLARLHVYHHCTITSVMQGIFRVRLTSHCVAQGVLFALHVVDTGH